MQPLERRAARQGLVAVSRAIRQSGVPVRQIQQPSLVASFRHRELHLAPGALGQPALERVAVLELDRHVHLGRRDAPLVELLHRRLHRFLLGRRITRRCLCHQLDPFDDSTAAHLEHLDDGAGRPDLHTERVTVSQPDRRHLLLAVPQRFDRLDGVPGMRRLLVLQVVGRRQHAAPQVGDQLAVAPFEEHPGVFYRLGVLRLAADLLDTGRDTALDVVFETGPPAPAGDDLVAGPDAEQLVGERHRLARQGRRQERTGVVVAVAGDPARHEHPRKRLGGGQLQIRIVLIIAQQDVEPRRALLDEVILERQCLDQRVGDDDLEPRHLIEQGIGLRARAVGAQVAADPVAQRASPTDIQRVAGVVEVEVDPRLLRQPRDLSLEIANGHGLHCEVRGANEG